MHGEVKLDFKESRDVRYSLIVIFVVPLLLSTIYIVSHELIFGTAFPAIGFLTPLLFYLK